MTSNIVLTFNTQVQAGTGLFELNPAGGGAQVEIGAASATYSTEWPWTVTINPPSDLAAGTLYMVTRFPRAGLGLRLATTSYLAFICLPVRSKGYS